MIQLRKKHKVPKTLKSKKVARVLAKVKAKVDKGEEVKSDEFPSYWLEDDVRPTLWEYQHKKCCYCERKRDLKREPDIEHFRPKTEIKEVGKPGYWWLAYNWDNLFFSCKKCNQTKLTQFPMIIGQHVRICNGDISKEKPVLPHPVDENPEDYIGFRWEFGKIQLAYPVGKDNDGRGYKTIKILGLDETNLAEERGSSLVLLMGLAQKMHAAKHLLGLGINKKEISETEKKIKQETKADKPFAGFRREFFRMNNLCEYVSNDR